MISIVLPTRTVTNELSFTQPYLSDVSELLRSVEVNPRREQRPADIGEFDDDDPESPGLVFTVFGEYRVPGGNWDAFRRELNSLAARGWFELTLITSVVRSVRVRVAGTVDFDLVDEAGYANWSIPLWAPDPRKYGPWQTQSTGLPVAGRGVESPLVSPFAQIGGGSPGRVALANAGTTDTLPELTVSGGGMTLGVQLTRIETAERIRLEWPILATDVIRFSFAEGQVWLNEQAPISGRLTVGQWWELGPGETATVQFEALGEVTGTPTLTARWRDADS